MTELERILAAPRGAPQVCMVSLPRAPGARPLRPIQERTLQLLAAAPHGVFGNIPVGQGKTLIGHLGPAATGTEGRALLVAPAAMRKATLKEHAEWAADYPVEPPTFVSYSQLSSPKAPDLLDRLDPRLIMFDEAHLLANQDSARTGRIMRWVMENWGRFKLLLMSGSFIGRTLLDFGHLAAMALGDDSPVPIGDDANVWAAVIDAVGEPGPGDLAHLAPLARRYRQPVTRRGVRKAFGMRIRDCPWVVWVAGSSCDKRITLRRWEFPLTPRTQTALRRLDTEWRLPNGDYLVDQLEMSRHQGTFPFGLWQVWDWEAVGGYDAAWDDARKGWASAVGRFLANTSIRGLDSRALVEEAMREGRLDKLRRPWEAWQEQAHKPEPPQALVVFDQQQVDAVRWACERLPEGTLVWYSTPAVADILESVMPVYRSGDEGPSHGKTAAVSILVHGRGWNAQYAYHRNLVLQPFADARRVEQLLGRTHRAGQERDVEAWFSMTTPSHKRAFYRAKHAAKVANDIGQDQKLVLAVDRTKRRRYPSCAGAPCRHRQQTGKPTWPSDPAYSIDSRTPSPAATPTA